MALEATKTGLVARVGDYEPLRAFSQGGRYWDRAAQQLIREGGLAEFLPPVEFEEDEYGKFGRFHCEADGRELLGGSRPVGRQGVPAEQLRRLRAALEQFQQSAAAPAIQPQNRELIERFQLPDLARHPELYRLVGPWWNRRLQILWGCERARDSSLPAQTAVGRLPADSGYRWRRWLVPLLLLLLLLLPAWWLARHGLPLGASRTPAGGTNALSSPSQDRAATPAEADRAAKTAQTKADQARAAANRARKEAAASRAEDARKRKQAEAAEAAAAKAEAEAKQARAAADQAKAEAAARFQIVLSEQGQPAVDGTMEVTLEVRGITNSTRAVPVDSWVVDGQTVTGQAQLRTRMKGGEHAVKALIRDSGGQPREITALVTVEPGKVIATGGKVSVQPQ